MYKLVKRYYGELCDKEKRDDIEVYDEEVIISNRRFSCVKYEMKRLIKEEKKNGFVLDKEYNGNCRTAIMFGGQQENWNAYIEIKIMAESIKNQIKIIANDYDKMTNIELDKKLLELEDSTDYHYQEIKNAVFEKVIERKLRSFVGSKTLNNKEFTDYVRELEKEFECEIDLIDFTITPKLV